MASEPQTVVNKKKADIEIIDFDDFVFCTTESKSITFNVGLFIEDDFVATKVINIDSLSLLGRLSSNELNSNFKILCYNFGCRNNKQVGPLPASAIFNFKF